MGSHQNTVKKRYFKRNSIMADVHNKRVRSYNMSRIKSKNTKPEMVVRKFLHANGLRFRIHVNALPGKPDIVLKKYNSVILIHGCFWHGHSNCKDFKMPKTRTGYWNSKITKNIDKDSSAKNALSAQNWRVITIWGCQLEADQKETTLKNLLLELVK